MINRRIVLASRPAAEATLDNFRLETVDLPALQDGQVLVRNHWLSLDPYMRMRMNEGKSYAAPQALGGPMVGGTAGEVIESRHERFKPGDKVVGGGGWQEVAVFDAGQPGVLRKVDDSVIPLSAYLGAVGMPGVTAWMGLTQIIEPKAGETVVVSAASGAVGSAVGQLAKAPMWWKRSASTPASTTRRIAISTPWPRPWTRPRRRASTAISRMWVA